MNRLAMIAQAISEWSVKSVGPGVSPCSKEGSHEHGDRR